jgi:hypothetical protein
MSALHFRDFLGLVTAFVVTLATQYFLSTMPAVELWSHDPKLYRQLFDDHPIANQVFGCMTFFVLPAFFAVLAGAAVSTTAHKKRNSWLYTIIGVCFYVFIFYKFLFIPHRETDDSATYVLFTGPQIYLLATGGILASLLVSYRQRKSKSGAESPEAKP